MFPDPKSGARTGRVSTLHGGVARHAHARRNAPARDPPLLGKSQEILFQISDFRFSGAAPGVHAARNPQVTNDLPLENAVGCAPP
jgi:hypothetical protein